MKIVLCGFGRAGLECLYQLLLHFNIQFESIIVFTHEDKENKYFIKHLKDNKINFFFQNINLMEKEVLKFSPQYILSIYYRYIIKESLLKIVNFKAMNLHPSLLPKYRGTKSSVWAILNNEKYTGISFHYMNKNIDDGRLLLQKRLKILVNDTAFSLYHKLISLSIIYFKEAFSLLLDGYKGFPQVGIQTYYKRELPWGGKQNFSQITIDKAKQFTRAMYFPPHRGALFIKDIGEEIELNSIEEVYKYKELFKKK